jgi:hypothetical protein
MSVVSRDGTTAYIGLPDREATKLEDLWSRDEIGLQLSVEVNAPVVVGVYPMRVARFVVERGGHPQVGVDHRAPIAGVVSYGARDDISA